MIATERRREGGGPRSIVGTLPEAGEVRIDQGGDGLKATGVGFGRGLKNEASPYAYSILTTYFGNVAS